MVLNKKQCDHQIKKQTLSNRYCIHIRNSHEIAFLQIICPYNRSIYGDNSQLSHIFVRKKQEHLVEHVFKYGNSNGNKYNASYLK